MLTACFRGFAEEVSVVLRIDEIMERELFGVRPGDPAGEVCGYLMALGIAGAPVLAGDGHPLGVVTLRGVIETDPDETAQRRMSRPAIAVRASAGIDDAGRLLAAANVQHLVVVDEQGVAVGAVGALDVIRGLMGLPSGRPPSPPLSLERELLSAEPRPLDGDRIEAAPVGPGVFVLSHGAGGPGGTFWVEAARDVRRRLLDILSQPQPHRPGLRRGIEHGGVHFRAVALDDLEQARILAARLLAALPTAPESRGEASP